MTIEQAAANLRKVRAARDAAERRAVEQLTDAIRQDLDRGVSVAAAARRAGVERQQVYRWLGATRSGA